ncbi:MAG: hypothetical protein ACRDAX_06000 [Propionibacteriaceae bacterium]
MVGVGVGYRNSGDPIPDVFRIEASCAHGNAGDVSTTAKEDVGRFMEEHVRVTRDIHVEQT